MTSALAMPSDCASRACLTNFAERIRGGMDRGCEHQAMAAHHEAKADGIERQLETTIYSDDADAIEALRAKIAKLSEKRDRMKASNAAYRKGDGAWAALRGITPERAASDRLAVEATWDKKPHAAWELTNLGATIRQAEKRIKEIERQSALTMKADAAGGVIIEGTEWIRVTFAERPERATLDALRSAGFQWGGGSWCGQRAKLPEGIAPA